MLSVRQKNVKKGILDTHKKAGERERERERIYRMFEEKAKV